MQATIAYFSISGKNEQMAKAVERELKETGFTTEQRFIKPKRPMGVIGGVLRSVFSKSVELDDLAALPDDDLLVLVGPVWAGSINPPMRAFLEKLPELKKRRVINLVCGFNPHPDVVTAIDRKLKARHAGPIASRAIRLRDMDSPEKTAAIASEIVSQVLA